MKIVLIGNPIKGGLIDSFFNAFLDFSTKNGNKVEILDDEEIYRDDSIIKNRHFHRLFWRFFAFRIQEKIKRVLAKQNPDLVLVFKGRLINPMTIREIKTLFPKAKLFNFNPDNPFNTWHHGNSNNWIRNSISLYDCYFIWGKFLIGPLYEAGAKMVEYLPFGYDSNLHYPIEVLDNEKRIYGSDIAFVGSWDKERERWLSYLLDYDLKIWGNHWQKANKKLQTRWQKKEVVGKEFSKVCGSAKIVLNFIRKQNGDAHNMRTFEIPACGGFVLATRTNEQKEFFKEGKEADYFSTPEELRQKIDFYLKSEDLRKKIALAGYQKLIFSHHSYVDRAQKIVESMNILDKI